MAKTLISTHTASASATLDITSGITSSYPVYEFHCVNIHAATDSTAFGFQFNAASGSNTTGFDQVITSTFFKAEHNEAAGGAGLGYSGGNDLAQGTTYQRLAYDMEIANDEAFSGILTLYDPSNTTFVKHFLATGNYVHHSDKYSQNISVAGYVNATEAIDEISFKMESGNIDAGVIKMFGVS